MLLDTHIKWKERQHVNINIQVRSYNTHLDFQRILYLWRHISLLITCLTRIHNGKESLQPIVNVDEASTFQMQLVHNANVRQWRNDGGWLVKLAALTLDGNKTQGTNKARVLCLEPKAVTVSKVNGYTQDGQALISSKGSSLWKYNQTLVPATSNFQKWNKWHFQDPTKLQQALSFMKEFSEMPLTTSHWAWCITHKKSTLKKTWQNVWSLQQNFVYKCILITFG
jgi:hypothetical protein